MRIKVEPAAAGIEALGQPAAIFRPERFECLGQDPLRLGERYFLFHAGDEWNVEVIKMHPVQSEHPLAQGDIAVE